MQQPLFYFLYCMKKLLGFIFFFGALHSFGQQIALQQGMVITQSTVVANATYVVKVSPGTDTAAVIITGYNIVVDFNHAILNGDDEDVAADHFQGCGIYIKDGSNITIRNLNVLHYKVAIRASNVKGLVIENCDAPFNYRKRLLSNWQREDISDWMSYHHNENDEWFRYGAAIYLRGCNNAIVRNNVVTNGQCALMMSLCDSARVYNNRFVFNSAIGIGMYRCSFNQVLYNQLDFNVRGFSQGYYWRGQDSAGILVFEQCNNNIYWGNSVTHGGDGFFLWAGQSTMDNGTGGCNNNVVVHNDFSYAPTNGIEATFSKNYFATNIVRGCDHGLWGGYSYQTDIINNVFDANRIGIAIEHGSNIAIAGNHFSNNKTAIRLWARKTQPGDWVYPKLVDTRSRNYCISRNDFTGDSTVYDLTLTDSVHLDFDKTKFKNTPTILKRSGDAMHIDTLINAACTANMSNLHKPMLNGVDTGFVTHEFGKLQRQYIRMNEWGPYDYTAPWARLIKKQSNGIWLIEMNGRDKEHWKIDSMQGVKEISATTGLFGDTISLRPSAQLVKVFFSKQQPSNVTPGMQRRVASFLFQEFELAAAWSINLYKWDSLDALKSNSNYFSKITSAKNAIPVKASAPDFVWWGSPGAPLPADSFVTVAVAQLELPAGKYSIGITADDMVRIYVDGKVVIDNWNAASPSYDDELYHETTVQLGGSHNIRIEHAEISGLSVLQFYMRPEKF